MVIINDYFLDRYTDEHEIDLRICRDSRRLLP